jgi:hypothetical protein
MTDYERCVMRYILRFTILLALVVLSISITIAQDSTATTFHYDIDNYEIIVNMDSADAVRYPLSVRDIWLNNIAISPDGSLVAYCYDEEYLADGTTNIRFMIEEFANNTIMESFVVNDAGFCLMNANAFSVDSPEFAFAIASINSDLFENQTEAAAWDYVIYNWEMDTSLTLEQTLLPQNESGYAYAIQTRVLTSEGVIFSSPTIGFESNPGNSDAYYWDFTTNTISLTDSVYGKINFLRMPNGENLYFDYDSDLPAAPSFVPFSAPNNVIRQGLEENTEQTIFFDSTKIIHSIEPTPSLDGIKVIYHSSLEENTPPTLAYLTLFRDGTISESIDLGVETYPTFLRLIPSDSTTSQDGFTPITPNG